MDAARINYFGTQPPAAAGGAALPESTSYESLYEEAKADPDVFSTYEIEELMKIVGEEKEHKLENLTNKIIEKELKKMCIKKFNNREAYDKLREGEYRYINELHELRLGRYIRWLREDGKLVAGGKLVRIHIANEHVVCTCISTIVKSGGAPYFFNVFFNKVHMFQKLTTDEKIILAVKDYLESIV